jgi:hypothetical protein
VVATRAYYWDSLSPRLALVSGGGQGLFHEPRLSNLLLTVSVDAVFPRLASRASRSLVHF